MVQKKPNSCKDCENYDEKECTPCKYCKACPIDGCLCEDLIK